MAHSKKHAMLDQMGSFKAPTLKTAGGSAALGLKHDNAPMAPKLAPPSLPPPSRKASGQGEGQPPAQQWSSSLLLGCAAQLAPSCLMAVACPCVQLARVRAAEGLLERHHRCAFGRAVAWTAALLLLVPLATEVLLPLVVRCFFPQGSCLHPMQYAHFWALDCAPLTWQPALTHALAAASLLFAAHELLRTRRAYRARRAIPLGSGGSTAAAAAAEMCITTACYPCAVAQMARHSFRYGGACSAGAARCAEEFRDVETPLELVVDSSGNPVSGGELLGGGGGGAAAAAPAAGAAGARADVSPPTTQQPAPVVAEAGGSAEAALQPAPRALAPEELAAGATLEEGGGAYSSVAAVEVTLVAGKRLGLRLEDIGGVVEVAIVAEGGAAKAAGVELGDRVVKVGKAFHVAGGRRAAEVFERIVGGKRPMTLQVVRTSKLSAYVNEGGHAEV